MVSSVLVEHFSAPPVCRNEVYRYADCLRANRETEEMFQSCWKEMEPLLSYRVCHCYFPCSVQGKVCRFGFGEITSESLARVLRRCDGVTVFAATVGLGADRLIARYQRVSPARAVMMSAIATHQVEALCDLFCEKLKRENAPRMTTARFSPGYGDLPLSFQNKIFEVLSPYRHVGISLNDQCFMIPTKSVTALVGIQREETNT